MATGIEQARPPKRDFATMIAGEAAERIRGVLPPGIEPKRFIQMAISAYNRNPMLRECTPESVIIDLIRCAEIGLVPNTAHGHAYLVPYNNRKQVNGKWISVKESQLQIGYKGFVFLAYKSGVFQTVDAREVYADDYFDLIYTPEPQLTHKPSLEGEKGPTTHFYAYAKSAGGILLEMMTREQVEKIRDTLTLRGQDKKTTPAWVSYFDEMAKKTTLKRLLKDQPCGDLVARAIEIDNETNAPVSISRSSPNQINYASRADALAAQLEPPPPDLTDDDLDDLAGEPGSEG